MKKFKSKKGFIPSTIGIVSLIFLGALVLTFMMIIIIRPISGKTSEKSFKFKNNIEKDYILKRIEEAIDSTNITSSIMEKREELDNEIIYSTGSKLLDCIIKPVRVKVDKDLIVVVASSSFLNIIIKILG